MKVKKVKCHKGRKVKVKGSKSKVNRSKVTKVKAKGQNVNVICERSRSKCGRNIMRETDGQTDADTHTHTQTQTQTHRHNRPLVGATIINQHDRLTGMTD